MYPLEFFPINSARLPSVRVYQNAQLLADIILLNRTSCLTIALQFLYNVCISFVFKLLCQPITYFFATCQTSSKSGKIMWINNPHCFSIPLCQSKQINRLFVSVAYLVCIFSQCHQSFIRREFGWSRRKTSDTKKQDICLSLWVNIAEGVYKNRHSKLFFSTSRSSPSNWWQVGCLHGASHFLEKHFSTYY